MKRWWQVGLVMLMGVVAAEEPEAKGFEWVPPEVGGGLFDDSLGMLDREREEYATNLAIQASNGVVAEEASRDSLLRARRLLALAMHLSPRNKRALVTRFQLDRGLMPKRMTREYSQEVLAGLLFTRAQILRQQGGEQNLLAARLFTELAVEMDPGNEDAVYAGELQRLDHGMVDWSRVTDVAADPGEGG